VKGKTETDVFVEKYVLKNESLVKKIFYVLKAEYV